MNHAKINIFEGIKDSELFGMVLFYGQMHHRSRSCDYERLKYGWREIRDA